MEILKEILKIVGDVGIFGLAMWFIQHLISKSANNKFEFYKTELDHKTREFQVTLDSKMELYRVELNLQNYKATQVYERQLNIIIELHKKLVKLNREMQAMTVPLKMVKDNFEQEEIDRIKNAGQSYDDFMQFYQDNLIFIPKTTVEKLDSLKNDYFSSYMDYTFGHRFDVKDKFTFEKTVAASDTVTTKIQPAVNQLVIDFRELIGVEKQIVQK